MLWPSRDRENKQRKTCSRIRILFFFFRFFVVAVTVLKCRLGQLARVRTHTPLQAHSHSLSSCLSRYIAHTYSGMMGALGSLPFVVVKSATAHPLSLCLRVCVCGWVCLVSVPCMFVCLIAYIPFLMYSPSLPPPAFRDHHTALRACPVILQHTRTHIYVYI